jgi:hypothetical protein
MSDYTNTTAAVLPVDEAWLHDWVAEGMTALERYLAKQAAFAEYLRSRPIKSADGDGAGSV